MVSVDQNVLRHRYESCYLGIAQGDTLAPIRSNIRQTSEMVYQRPGAALLNLPSAVQVATSASCYQFLSMQRAGRW